MKKNIYLLLALLSLTTSVATQKLAINLIVASTLLTGAKHHNRPSLDLNDLDEKQALDLILNNYLRETEIKTNLPNELRQLIHRFFIHEWAIQGFNKNTGTAYDPHDFDIRGLHKKTKNRLDPRGFKQNGYYKNVDITTGNPTKYDPQGYDIDGWNKYGLHENGRILDHNGFAQHINHANIGLYKAIKNRNIKAVTLLLKQPNINVNLKNYYGYTPLRWCCRQGDKSLQIAKALLGHKKINVNLKDVDAYTPLIWCCWAGDKSLGIAKALLEHDNINVNLGDVDGYTPLIWCCRQGDKSLQIAKALLEHKDTNTNLVGKYDYTPLDWIIYSVLNNDKYYQYVNLWNVLVEKGAVLNQCKKYYKNLNPNDFQEPQRTHVALIKQTPPISCNKIKRITHQQCKKENE